MYQIAAVVAPARGRGLKFHHSKDYPEKQGRPREGAWIEIQTPAEGTAPWYRRPREGAWIEMPWMPERLWQAESPPRGGVD
mgnify:CR=1 FL=1